MRLSTGSSLGGVGHVADDGQDRALDRCEHRVVGDVRAPAQPVREMAAEPLTPGRPVQPWTEPVPTAAPPYPETDPVARLVRQGTLDHPPRRPTGAP